MFPSVHCPVAAEIHSTFRRHDTVSTHVHASRITGFPKTVFASVLVQVTCTTVAPRKGSRAHVPSARRRGRSWAAPTRRPRPGGVCLLKLKKEVGVFTIVYPIPWVDKPLGALTDALFRRCRQSSFGLFSTVNSSPCSRFLFLIPDRGGKKGTKEVLKSMTNVHT